MKFLEHYVSTALEFMWVDAPQRLAVFGPGGIGKTELVLNLAYRVAEQHPDISVFWLPATSVETFERAAEKATKQLGIRSPANQSEDAKDLLNEYLSGSSARRWLLIVDDADDIEILEPSASSDGLLRCLPENPLGVTVFTTCSSQLAQRLSGSELLRLKKLTENEAAELLKLCIIDSDLLNDPTAVTKFLTELGHEPSAITKAAAYINDTETSLSEYSRLFRSTESATSSAIDNIQQQTPQRRHRRIPVPYAYLPAANSTVHYTPHDTDSLPTSSASGAPLLSLRSANMFAGLQRIKPCYLMIALGVLMIGGSLAVGIFYSISEDRMGDGFTTAGWMVAVSTLVLAAPMAKHYPNCRCWGGQKTAVL
jgi:hypothetical protein